MSLFFANPVWWLGALALVPLAAHLLSRTRPRKRPFPSLVLLREAIRRVTRVRRPQDRWLLILRTLAVLALILAFLQPWLRSSLASGNSAARTVVLVVDSSASMGYADKTWTRLSQATGAAEEILASLPQQSRANVVWIRGKAVGVLPEPDQNLDFLREELRKASALPEAGDVDGALALALKQLAASEGERELCVISDFQRSAWADRDWSMPPGVRLTRLAVGEESESNVAIGELSVEPSEPIAGQPVRIVARIRNLSADARRVTVFGEAGPSRLSQSLELAPWSDGLAVMPVTLAAEGQTALRVAVEEDRYPGDDVRYALVEVRGDLPVGVVGNPEDSTPATWLRALRALDGVSGKMVPRGSIASAGVRILFVAAWDGGEVESLRAFLKSGGALVVQPAPALNADQIRALLGDRMIDGDGSIGIAERAEPGWGLRIAAEEHPIFALFASGAYGDPAAGRFLRRTTALAGLKGFRTLLEFEDRVPALSFAELEMEGAPIPTVPFAWWNLDLGASDWATKTAFLPWFGEWVQYLARATQRRAIAEVPPGEFLRMEVDPAIDPRDVELRNPQDQKLELRKESGAAGGLVTVDSIRPGDYRWMAQGGVLRREVVNFPAMESDLRRLAPSALEESGGTVIGNAGNQKLDALRQGVSLWPWCILVAVFCLLLEGWVLRGIARTAPVSSGAHSNRSAESKEVAAV